MMGVDDLQTFLRESCLEGGAVPVDLLKIARNVTQRQQNNTHRRIKPVGTKLKLIVDAENCLDRLYGGYFSDWACGGQWNRMVQFLSLLTRAIERGNIELVVVFNGTIESCRMNEWVADQANTRQNVGMVLKHINNKATPPPKVWWTAPICLRSALRMALRHLGVTVMCTLDDHHQEVIAYCRENGFHGLLADDGEYAAFDPPRYFSAENLKLTYKGSLETKEYMLGEVLKSLEVSQEQVCVMAALLGNFLLPASCLQDLHKRIGLTAIAKDNKLPAEHNVKRMAEFVRNLPPPSDLDALVEAALRSSQDKRVAKLKQSIQYYLNGTANGFLKYGNPVEHSKDNKKVTTQNNNVTTPPIKEMEELEVSGTNFASETSEQVEESIKNYKLATVNLVLSEDYPVDSNGTSINNIQCNGFMNGSSTNSAPGTSKVSSNSSITSSSLPSSPKVNQLHNLVTPTVSSDVLRTASLRHQKGLMASMILHVLGTQEVRLPCLMEDEGNRELPPIHDVYQILRQRVYAVLFNLHHLRYVHAKKKESGEIPENSPQPDIIVREWIYSRANPYQVPENIKAEPLPWAVPTLQRLWFGPAVDDKRRRMRALLSCLNSDTPLILNTSYVPQHMLIMACVLRYIMSQERAIVRRNELDAFLCQAFNVDLMNPQYLQELTLNVVSSRGVQLAALFMEGVEMALLANDACGAPLPWLMCCPWLYFDGKLFHYTLSRSAQSKNILEVCENHIDRVVKVERMRKAILEGLDVKFAKVPLPSFQNLMRGGMPVHSQGLHPPPGMGIPPQHQHQRNINPAGMHQRPISSRGGQLQVAGVVVGSWGANYGSQRNMRQPMCHQGFGGGYQGGRGRGGVMGPVSNNNYGQQNYQRGKGQHRKPGPPIYATNNRKNNTNKKRANMNNKSKNQTSLPEHVLTIKTESGDIPSDEIIVKDDGTICAGGNNEDCIKNAPDQNHHGQGDAPPPLVE